MDLLENLNPAQRLAVTTTEGPVMVMAGAGSGKTKVLTTRISYIIESLNVAPSRILAVTFTNKAALEMKNRISSMLDIDTSNMWVSTFHSFCAKLLRIEVEYLTGYNKDFIIIDEDDSIKKIRDIMKEQGINTDFISSSEMKKYISNNKNFKDYKVKDKYLEVFLKVNSIYEEECLKENLIDFDDLIIKAIDLLNNNPLILKKYQDKFQYIMVDEFQDTNAYQYELIWLLAKEHNNIFVVGDDFQSIYSFRGAIVDNVLKFQSDFKGTKTILLDKNYRSTTQILDVANDVSEEIVNNNPSRIKKVMFSNDKIGVTPKYYLASSSNDEAAFVVSKIMEGIKNGKKYSDFAIMYRNNSISRFFEELLVKNRIPYTVYGGISFYSRVEVKNVIAYLRVLIHPDDDFSFKRIVNVPKRKIGAKVLENLSIKAKENGVSLFEAIEYYTGSGIGADNLRAFKKVIDDLRCQIETLSLSDLIDEIIERVGYEEELKKDLESYDDKMGNIDSFSNSLKENALQYDSESHFEILEKELADLALRTDHDDVKSDESVRLTTFHQAKGLEFDTVFMVAMERGIFPSNLENVNIEEERRICYVGVTRAKNELYLSSAKYRYLFGKEYFEESPFIKEILELDHVDNLSKPRVKNKTPLNEGYKIAKAKFSVKKEEPKKQDNAEVPCSFNTGDKIHHEKYGDGLVVAVSELTITVAFAAPFGVKILKANHPSIRKL